MIKAIRLIAAAVAVYFSGEFIWRGYKLGEGVKLLGQDFATSELGDRIVHYMQIDAAAVGAGVTVYLLARLVAAKEAQRQASV